MRVEILRTPGLDLAHDLALKGVTGPVEIPKDATEGDVIDLADDVADALIAAGIARKTDAEKTDKAHKGDKADQAGKAGEARPAPQPAKGHATPPKS